MSDEVKEIVQREIEAQGNPSLRKFASWLNEGLSKDGDVLSHASVINWLNGRSPQTEFLEDMLTVYSAKDRRFIFALRLLAAKSPHVWGFEGIVWRISDLLKNDQSILNSTSSAVGGDCARVVDVAHASVDGPK